MSLDPLSLDPLLLDPLTLDPLSLDPLSLIPLLLDPLSLDPLSLDPLTSDPLSLDPLSLHSLLLDPLSLIRFRWFIVVGSIVNDFIAVGSPSVVIGSGVVVSTQRAQKTKSSRPEGPTVRSWGPLTSCTL